MKVILSFVISHNQKLQETYLFLSFQFEVLFYKTSNFDRIPQGKITPSSHNGKQVVEVVYHFLTKDSTST